jgi:hypothetical protein
VQDETVSLRVIGSAPGAPVGEPGGLALGARAGIDVGRLDELAMAFGLAARRAGRPLTVELTVAAGRLVVTIRPVDVADLDDCRQAIDRLVGAVAVERDGQGLVLRAG